MAYNIYPLDALNIYGQYAAYNEINRCHRSSISIYNFNNISEPAEVYVLADIVTPQPYLQIGTISIKLRILKDKVYLDAYVDNKVVANLQMSISKDDHPASIDWLKTKHAGRNYGIMLILAAAKYCLANNYLQLSLYRRDVQWLEGYYTRRGFISSGDSYSMTSETQTVYEKCWRIVGDT